jgi:hypothetical protein
MDTPILTKIKAGWSAKGNGRAVHGATREEAVRLYNEASDRYNEIAARSSYAGVEADQGRHDVVK